MTNDCRSTLIVAKPGPLRDGLRALMTAVPQIEVVEEMNDVSSALQDGDSRHCPALVLLDCDLAGDDIGTTVRQTKAKWPQARCVFLANNVQQHYEGETAGADAVLLKGMPPARIIATVVRLLPHEVF